MEFIVGEHPHRNIILIKLLGGINIELVKRPLASGKYSTYQFASEPIRLIQNI